MREGKALNGFYLGWVLTFLAAFSDTFSAMIVKWRYNQLGEFDFNSYAMAVNYFFQFIQSPVVILAFILFLLAPVFWFIALNRIPLSTGYPVLISLHLLLVMLFSVFILGEEIGPHKIAAIGCIFGSLYFFYRS